MQPKLYIILTTCLMVNALFYLEFLHFLIDGLEVTLFKYIKCCMMLKTFQYFFDCAVYILIRGNDFMMSRHRGEYTAPVYVIPSLNKLLELCTCIIRLLTISIPP